MHAGQLCKEMPLSALLAVQVGASLPSSGLVCFLGVHFRLQLYFGAADDFLFQLAQVDKRPPKHAVCVQGLRRKSCVC